MEKPSIPKGSLKALQIVHRAMLLGMVLFACIAFFLHYSGNFPPSLQQQDQLLQVIAIVLATAGFFMGNKLFSKKDFSITGISGRARC